MRMSKAECEEHTWFEVYLGEKKRNRQAGGRLVCSGEWGL